MIDVEAMRGNLHATFNGGNHEENMRRAFHHGMDTVCNVLDAWQHGAGTNGILPPRKDLTTEMGQPLMARLIARLRGEAFSLGAANEHEKAAPYASQRLRQVEAMRECADRLEALEKR